MLRVKQLDVDLCVVGGGMAGMLAAIAAARHGSKVALVHERPVLGGNASSEVRMWISGAHGKNNRETGILEEISLENFYRNPTKNYQIWDTVLYDFVKREENITLLMNCTCMDAKCESGEYAYGRTTRIHSIKAYQMTTQTFFEVSAKYFADCSGDSILAPLTGAEYRLGREAAGEFGEDVRITEADDMVMGMSCIIQGRETTKEIKFTAPWFSTKLSLEDLKNRPLTGTYDPTQNYWFLELGGNRDTIHETEEIKEELIALALGAWDHIKNSGEEDTRKWELEFLGMLPGKRESRRMCGEYMITQKDIMEDRIFEDTVAFGGWTLDDHFPGGFYHKGEANTHRRTPSPYCIPYRALYSKNVDNLFFAGRNISMTHAAMSSIRVMATCALLGQAVGTAAALAAKYDLAPHGVYEACLGELKELLMQDDSFLPHFRREVSDLCKVTPVCCVDEKGNAVSLDQAQDLKTGEDRPNRVYGTETCGVCVQNGHRLQYEFQEPQFVKELHVVFDSDLDRETLPGHWVERQRSMRANVLLESPQMHMPKTLCKEFIVSVRTVGGTEELLHVTENRRRSHHLKVGKEVLGLEMTIVGNWGDQDQTNVFSFDFI